MEPFAFGSRRRVRSQNVDYGVVKTLGDEGRLNGGDGRHCVVVVVGGGIGVAIAIGSVGGVVAIFEFILDSTAV